MMTSFLNSLKFPSNQGANDTFCEEEKLLHDSDSISLRIAQDRASHLEINSLRRRLRNLWLLLGGLITLQVLLICTLLPTGIINLSRCNTNPSCQWASRNSSDPSPENFPNRCGNSIAEAKSLNCSFDILSKAWLPADCSRLGSAEYLRDSWGWNHTGWGIYSDRFQTRELTMNELMGYADTGEKWYGTEREHLVHCAWGLKRVLDGYYHGKKMDYIIQQLHHTTHCVDRLYMSAVKAPDLDVVLGKGNIRFGIC
ncbi:hypothetical protein N656DRAFT_591117 [Canariomyces notabilis]|uniref:Uncharacterized protein n=1 Tax=Canariomyces notabilis TaxID=2074819 RepID=A0AAN6THV0_9PEZI|nr:hypothetical protein N656DRAFT_591117 [Canariomyces arenarius]